MTENLILKKHKNNLQDGLEKISNICLLTPKCLMQEAIPVRDVKSSLTLQDYIHDPLRANNEIKIYVPRGIHLPFSPWHESIY